MKRAEERRKTAEGPAREALGFFQAKNQHARINVKLLQFHR